MTTGSTLTITNRAILACAVSPPSAVLLSITRVGPDGFYGHPDRQRHRQRGAPLSIMQRTLGSAG